MAKKRNKAQIEKELDPDLIRQFMLGGVDFKDDKSGRSAESSPSQIDLHLDETGKISRSLPDGDKLQLQLEHLEKQIDRALASGKTRIDVIHGKGEGRLKRAVEHFLKKHPHVKSFRSIDGKTHDGGATEVFFK